MKYSIMAIGAFFAWSGDIEQGGSMNQIFGFRMGQMHPSMAQQANEKDDLAASSQVDDSISGKESADEAPFPPATERAATAHEPRSIRGAATLSTRQVAAGLTNPVFVTAPLYDFNRLFIVEQPGRIQILDLGTESVLGTPFLNITSLVSSGGERGLLGLAFHPNYDSTGFFYVYYTNLSGNIVIARYSVSGNPNVANAGSATILKTFVHDFSNHNGGCLQFGPDGKLYAGSGDGGSANDPNNRAQSTHTLLGKMLRLDVNNAPSYIPADNPYVGPGDPLDEIWAIGLRNPWRFSFDRLTGDLYIGDVGQGNWEEVSFAPASSTGGENYGWRCMEGDHCTSLSGCGCNNPAWTGPIHEYGHDIPDSPCHSITGGYVYRGSAIPTLSGTYFFAEYCADVVWSFRYSGGMVTEFADRTAELAPPPGQGSLTSIGSFGEDAAGELYIVTLSGQVYKIESCEGGCRLYGDVFPQGLSVGDCEVDVADILCALDGFGDMSLCPQADIANCLSNGVLDVGDVLAVLDAFTGTFLCPHPCPP